MTEVSLLSSHLALPQKGHLEAVFRIFPYLKIKNNSRMILDPTYFAIDMKDFKQCDWTDFYPDAVELIPPNAHDPRGREV